jgi:SAM-dependent methyltransferase
MPRPLSYGPAVSDERTLRLAGDLTGKRAVELGISGAQNAVALAEAGAKSIAVDPDQHRIDTARCEAERAGVRVEFHRADLADLGFATSASVDVVVSTGTLVDVDDLPRVLRQVHRILRPEAPMLIAVPHPAMTMLDPATLTVHQRYGTSPGRSVADLFTALLRANFRVDSIHELFATDAEHPLVPSVLVLRARKLGV